MAKSTSQHSLERLSACSICIVYTRCSCDGGNWNIFQVVQRFCVRISQMAHCPCFPLHWPGGTFERWYFSAPTTLAARKNCSEHIVYTQLCTNYTSTRTDLMIFATHNFRFCLYLINHNTQTHARRQTPCINSHSLGTPLLFIRATHGKMSGQMRADVQTNKTPSAMCVG